MPVCPDVVTFLRRIDPTTAPPYPGYQAIAYALEHGLEPDEVRARFDEHAAIRVSPGFVGNPFLASFAILALRLLPERALPLVRAALRSSTPVCVQEMAAVLALLDQRWCRRELIAALEADVQTRDILRPILVSALRHSSSEPARHRAQRYDIAPRRDPQAIGYTSEELAFANADVFMARAMERARPRADELRGRYPDDWSGG